MKEVFIVQIERQRIRFLKSQRTEKKRVCGVRLGSRLE